MIVEERKVAVTVVARCQRRYLRRKVGVLFSTALLNIRRRIQRCVGGIDARGTGYDPDL